MQYKIAQFILTPPQRGQSSLEIYVSQPDANKEALAGKLFVLIEIESTKADNLKIINFLINSLSHDYYQNEKMILRERVSSVKIEHIFESALAKTNKKLAEFLQSEKIKLNPDILNITIGVVYNDSLHFANLGKNKALLIYKNKNEETAKYKLADITEQTDGKEIKKPANAVKLFSNVVSGALPRSGYFVFANETFSEYLSAKQIIDIITTLPPASAAEQIKNTLSKINAYVPFLGIIIKNTALEAQEIKIKQTISSTQASINNLISTEEKTEKLLTPSGLISANKWPDFFNILNLRTKFGQTGKASGKTFLLKDKIFSKRKSFWQPLVKIYNFLKNILAYAVNLLIFIFKIITDKKALIEFWQNFILKIKNISTSAKSSFFSAVFWYKSLNRINKILLSAFTICLLIFFVSLGWQNRANVALEKQAANDALITAIEQKQNQIEASLLYNNETGAKKLLDEVEASLSELPQKTQTQKEQYNALEAKYKVQIEKISRVVKVDPVELADFLKLDNAAQPNNLILTNGKLFAADSARKAIYTLDLKTKLATSISLKNQPVNSLNYPSLDKNGNIYYLNSSGLEILDTKTEKISSLAVEFSGSLNAAIDLKQYNNRFYLADKADGQIYRFTKNADKLTGAAPWLNGKQDLSKAVSMDIDGSIYLLKNDGSVAKYAKGRPEDFTISQIEPAFSQAAEISATADQIYIYIFEPAAKRLIVLDKTGKLINQFVSDKFNNLKDFQVDETNKKIYFLDGAKVYSIDAAYPDKK